MPADDVDVQQAFEAERIAGRVLTSGAAQPEATWTDSIKVLRDALADFCDDVRVLARMVPPQHRERRSALLAAAHVRRRLKKCVCERTDCHEYRYAVYLALAWDNLRVHEQCLWAVLRLRARRAAPRGDQPRPIPAAAPKTLLLHVHRHPRWMEDDVNVSLSRPAPEQVAARALEVVDRMEADPEFERLRTGCAQYNSNWDDFYGAS